jgi:hypothetical protein
LGVPIRWHRHEVAGITDIDPARIRMHHLQARIGLTQPPLQFATLAPVQFSTPQTLER